MLPPRAPRKGQPGMTPAPGGRRQESNVGLRRGNSGPARLPEAGRGGARPPSHGWVGTEGGLGQARAQRGGRRAPATYQQALHVDGRARVSDQRLQLPLAAGARPVPRHGVGGAGHLPRRRGPAHAAAAARPRTRAPRAPARAPRGLAPSPHPPASPEPPAPGGAPPRAHRAPLAPASGLGAGPGPGAVRGAARPGRERRGADGVPAPQSDSRRPVRSSAASSLRTPKAGAGKRRGHRRARTAPPSGAPGG